ncbi:hypothetical protein JMJ35_001613 [Cladonia borealis]|uniref:DUF202 domain-containing protein n=1 Tax=Cladonia borealis TaxID=184061 RepID=A0AA39V739_9LECA|nr:hypothetical protein JMJ35_001613 [Cladonia borealis]
MASYQSVVPPSRSDHNEREATELNDYEGDHLASDYHTTSAAPETYSGPSVRNENYALSFRRSTVLFWKRQVSATVPHECCRDHFALERTFLGYLRTSLALSIIAVIIAQLFRLEHNANPNKIFGFYALGIPLACTCIGAAMVILLLGAYRFWRQQNAILRGKVHVGGWEVNAVGVTVSTVTLALFVLIVALDITKDVEGQT